VSTPDPEIIVEVSGVTCRYGTPGETAPALEDIDLTIRDDDFLGLIGPNGGGKTTLLKLLLGLIRPQAGAVRVLGRDPREVSRQVGYVPQTAQIDHRAPATVRDVVLTGRLGLTLRGFGYGRDHLREADRAMEEAEVLTFADRRIGELSGGQRQRVLIARALASDVRILLLDEPMAGVDLHMEAGILDTLKRLNESMPVVLVSHDISFVSAHLKRVACLNRRMVVHRADEVSGEVIAEMYAAHGPVSAVGHQHNCPLPDREQPGATS
jgi:zinc transport system ATP-binding protein